MSSSDSYSGSGSFEEFVITDASAFGCAVFGLLLFLLICQIDRMGDRRVS